MSHTPDSAAASDPGVDSAATETAPAHTLGPVLDTAAEHPHFRMTPVSFVRRSSRLTSGQASAMERSAAEYVVEVPRAHAETSIAAGHHIDLPTLFGRTAHTVIEIGTGMGECVTEAAIAHPETNFLALEVYPAGIAQTVLRAERGDAHNVRVIEANAPEVLDTLDDASVDEIWLFFPDPWHKVRHNKRRIVQSGFADQVARVLRPGGIWRLATDWEPYAEHMIEVFEGRTDLVPLVPGSQGIVERFEGRVLTTFEAKGQRAGRGATDLAFVRV